MEALENTSDILFGLLYASVLAQYVITLAALPVLPYIVMMCQVYLFYVVHCNQMAIIRNTSSLPCTPP